MTTIVRTDNLVRIPDEIAVALNLREGSSIEWESVPDGSVVIRSKPKSKLRGMLKPYLKAGESGVAEFLKWREQDALLDGSR